MSGSQWAPPPALRAQLRRQEEELRLLEELAQARPLRGLEIWYVAEVRRRCARLREQVASRHPTAAPGDRHKPGSDAATREWRVPRAVPNVLDSWLEAV